VASDQHWRGRPFADALAFSAPDPRAAARTLESGGLDLSLRPEPSPGAAPLPLLTAAYAHLNGRRGPAPPGPPRLLRLERPTLRCAGAGRPLGLPGPSGPPRPPAELGAPRSWERGPGRPRAELRKPGAARRR
jgi:hypothetical protein